MIVLKSIRRAGLASGERLPTGWIRRPLLDLVTIAQGQVDPKKEPYSSMILIAPDHIESGTGRLLERRTAAEQHAISGKLMFAPGDIVYSKIRPNLRKACQVDFSGLCSADMYPMTPSSTASAGFVLATLLSGPFTRFAEGASARSGIPKINRAELSQFEVEVPPLPEQNAIAAALSDLDSLVERLDGQIAKKRAMQQGAIQQLLTGRTRLKGFTSLWKRRQIGDLAEIDPENLAESTDPNFQFNYISLERVDRGRLVGFTEERFATAPSRARRVLQPGDVLLGTVRPNLQSHLLYDGMPACAICSTGFAVLRCRRECAVPTFVFSHLFGREINTQFERILAGSNYPAINRGEVAQLEISCPAVEEQAAITAILSAIDAEIAALGRRRSKVHAIKHGMMQALLTGRVRLIESSSALPLTAVSAGARTES